MNTNISLEKTSGVLSWEECMRLLADLPAMSSEDRSGTIRLLLRNPSVEIRQHALRSGAETFTQEELVRYLREDSDDVVRNAGLEMLKLQGVHAFPLALQLARDADTDVVLQAILLLDHICDPRAMDTFQSLLHHEDSNVVQAAIVGIGRLGDSRAVPELAAFMSKDLWLQMAAVQAFGDLRSAAAVPILKGLLNDSFLGALAIESLARIGGPAAFKVMALNWVKYHNRMEAETKLGLLAHVLEGLAHTPREVAGLRPVLAQFLNDSDPKIRKCAARCLVSLGPGAEDEQALSELAQDESGDSLPASLNRRSDLVEFLLRQEPVLLFWGLWLACRNPKAASANSIESAFAGLDAAVIPESLLEALSSMKHAGLGSALLDLFERSPLQSCRAIVPMLQKNKEFVRASMANRPHINTEVELVLSAILGTSAASIVSKLLTMSPEARAWVVDQIADKKSVMRKLPWRLWLEDDPEAYRAIAISAAVRTRLPEILEPLLKILSRQPSAEIISAMGEAAYRESVPVLLDLLRTLPGDSKGGALRWMILETLGRIGGEEAYRALKEIVMSGDPISTKAAFKGLSLCASEEDSPLFRASVTSPEWYIRLACAEVLGQDPSPENLIILGRLAADPVAIVSQRAKALIESLGERA